MLRCDGKKGAKMRYLTRRSSDTSAWPEVDGGGRYPRRSAVAGDGEDKETEDSSPDSLPACVEESQRRTTVLEVVLESSLALCSGSATEEKGWERWGFFSLCVAWRRGRKEAWGEGDVLVHCR